MRESGLKSSGWTEAPPGTGIWMQFQSDILDIRVLVPDAEELSGIGAAYAAGLALGFFDRSIFGKMKRSMFEPAMDQDARRQKQDGWRAAVGTVLTRS